MTELRVTEEETQLLNLYRSMDADVKEFALMVFNEIKENGKKLIKFKVVHNGRNSVVGDHNTVYIGGKEYLDDSPFGD